PIRSGAGAFPSPTRAPIWPRCARAEPAGDDFIVNGQKIRTSYAQDADWCYMLVRTDPAAPRHRGISHLIADMKSPGIKVKPLRQMHGGQDFNEVFFRQRAPAEG